MKFAAHNTHRSIAIIDTALLSDPISIYHSPQLEDNGLSGLSYSYEYLACGPIAGHAYHCVAFNDIEADLDKLGWNHNASSLYVPKNVSARIIEEHVAIARRVAKRFRRPGDHRPDVVLLVTVTLLSNIAYRLPSRQSDIVELLIKGLRDELMIYCYPTSRGRFLGLANPATPVKGQPLMRMTLDLLTAMEQRIATMEECE